MANPYRTRPSTPPPPKLDERRLHTATLAFGFLCVTAGAACSGKDFAKTALLGTLGGVVVLLSPRVGAQRAGAPRRRAAAPPRARPVPAPMRRGPTC